MNPNTNCLTSDEVGMANYSLIQLNASDTGLYPNLSYPCDLNHTSSRTNPVMPLYITVTSTLLYVIIFLTGTLGNSIVAAVVGLHHDMRSSTNLFLVNLALADLMVIVICMPTALVDIYAEDQWFFGSVMCKMVPLLEHSASHASVLTMLVIAAERFQAICHPLKLRGARLYSTTTKLIIVLLIWLIAVLCSTPFMWIAVHRDSKHHDGTKIKVCRQYLIQEWQKAYAVCLFCVFFALPFVLLAMLYIIIARALVQEFKYSNKMAEQGNRNKNKARRKVVVMLIFITILFFVFHLPFRTVSLWMTFDDPAKVRELGFEGYWNLLCFVRIMFYLNSCTNPIIYNLISTKFRHAFVRILMGKRRMTYRESSYTTGGTHATMKLVQR